MTAPNGCDASVLLLVRDRAEALPTVLTHLERQTFPSGRFEVVVVDWGGRDGSMEVLTRYREGAPMRLRALDHAGLGAAAARNRAVREAQGRIIIFLHQDLLASPGLVEEHVAVHEAAQAPCAVAGGIARHPQFSDSHLSSWFMPDDAVRLRPAPPKSFLDWRCENFSLPRETVLELGGFDEGFRLSFFEGAELAWRLRERAYEARFAESAIAYVYRPSTVSEERDRAYAKGYSLYLLQERTRAREIVRAFPLGRGRVLGLVDRLLQPVYLGACSGAEDVHLLGHLYRRVLVHALRRGYTDARRGRPPQVDF